MFFAPYFARVGSVVHHPGHVTTEIVLFMTEDHALGSDSLSPG
jgi:hypothetical protein